MTQSVVGLSMHKLGFLFIFCLLLFGSCYSIPEKYKIHKGNIYKEYNAFEDISFYQHKNFLLRKGFSVIFNLYIVQTKKDKTLRVEFRYGGSSWMFFKQAILLSPNEKRMVFDWSRSHKTNETYSGGISEKADFSLNKQQIKELKEILTSNTIKLRLTGKFYDDTDISLEHIKFLREMIVFFESL